MLKTILILLITFIVLPVVAVRFDQSLDSQQWHMLLAGVYIMLGVAAACFILGEVTSNTSQVDKIWSITPVIYAWVFAALANWQPRLILMAVIVTVWGIRLTYNFGRKGGYSWKFWGGEEDYRWAVVRENPILKGRIRWMLFDLFFISLYQNALLLMITLPMIVVCGNADNTVTIWDIVIAGLYVGFVIIETVADQQQWNFQQEKNRRKKSGIKPEEEYANGFISSGLFAKVRHPNYAAEQAIWICFYLFSIAATGRWLNWSAAGCLLLVVLFQSSSEFSEGISLRKYPAYLEFKKRVPRFVPRFW